jgi:hypothetical protein
MTPRAGRAFGAAFNNQEFSGNFAFRKAKAAETRRRSAARVCSDSILTVDVKQTTASAQTMSTTILHGLTPYPVGFYGRPCQRKVMGVGSFLELDWSIPETSKVKVMTLADPVGRG